MSLNILPSEVFRDCIIAMPKASKISGPIRGFKQSYKTNNSATANRPPLLSAIDCFITLTRMGWFVKILRILAGAGQRALDHLFANRIVGNTADTIRIKLAAVIIGYICVN